MAVDTKHITEMENIIGIDVHGVMATDEERKDLITNSCFKFLFTGSSM